MTARTTRGRHRAARRPIALATNGTAGRRAAVVATAGGLLVSSIATASAAQAAPVDNDAAKKLSTVDLGALTDQARQSLEAAPVVAVDAKAKVDVEKVTAKIAAKTEITPAPEPEPVVVETEVEAEVAEEATASASTDTASRSAEREEISAPASANGSEIVSIAMRYVGVPYVSGGTTPSGFDCSGLTSYVFAQVGIDLPRTSSAQRYAGTVVSASEAQPGDLVWSPGHVAIYAGGGMQVDAPKPGDVVKYRSIWQSNPTFIRVA